MLLDVDGTLIDALENQRRVWHTWASHYGLDPSEVYRIALRTRPQDTFRAAAPHENPEQCLELLHLLEDEDARNGTYSAFPGATELLAALPPRRWALVTSNYGHRVRTRFHRTNLPLPSVIIDAPATAHGKPHPAPYLLAARRLGTSADNCLVIEDSAAGVTAARAAGMTLWTVNTATAPPGSQRHYLTLQAATADILSFLR